MSTTQRLKDEVTKLQFKLADKNTKAAKANKVLSDENNQLKKEILELKNKIDAVVVAEVPHG